MAAKTVHGGYILEGIMSPYTQRSITKMLSGRANRKGTGGPGVEAELGVDGTALEGLVSERFSETMMFKQDKN